MLQTGFLLEEKLQLTDLEIETRVSPILDPLSKMAFLDDKLNWFHHIENIFIILEITYPSPIHINVSFNQI